MQKRTKWGVAITLLWIISGGAISLVEAQAFTSLSPNEWGDFLAGFFAPLAFLWIIIAYLQQGDELQQNTKALQLQQEELAAQVQESRRQANLMEKRFRLQRSARREEAQKAKQAIQPNFESKGGRGDADKWKMKVENTGGGPAQNLAVTLDGEELSITSSDYVKPGGVFKIVIPKTHNSGKIVFHYTDQEGDEQSQQYQYVRRAKIRPALPRD